MTSPYLLIGVLIALLVSFLGGGVCGYRWEANRVPGFLEAQQTVDQKQCDIAQLVTKGANDALQKDRDAIAAKLNTLSVQHPRACVRIASTPKLPASGSKPSGQNGDGPSVNSDWLRAYAAEAELYRDEVNVCQKFLEDERKAISQK